MTHSGENEAQTIAQLDVGYMTAMKQTDPVSHSNSCLQLRIFFKCRLIFSQLLYQEQEEKKQSMQVLHSKLVRYDCEYVTGS